MITTSADAERVEIHIIYEPNPSPARQILWARLWQRLLAPDHNGPTPAPDPEEVSAK
jgi:hypothetical protein